MIEDRIRALNDDRLAFAELDCYQRLRSLTGEPRRQLRHALAVILVERRKRRKQPSGND